MRVPEKNVYQLPSYFIKIKSISLVKAYLLEVNLEISPMIPLISLMSSLLKAHLPPKYINISRSWEDVTEISNLARTNFSCYIRKLVFHA
jgi:hypothetical protein